MWLVNWLTTFTIDSESEHHPASVKCGFVNLTFYNPQSLVIVAKNQMYVCMCLCHIANKTTIDVWSMDINATLSLICDLQYQTSQSSSCQQRQHQPVKVIWSIKFYKLDT